MFCLAQAFALHVSQNVGWIHVLIPYLERQGRIVENPYLASWEQGRRRVETQKFGLQDLLGGGLPGPPINELPSSPASAPVLVIEADTGRGHDMRFIAGMFGVVQDRQTLSLAREFGWAIVTTDWSYL